MDPPRGLPRQLLQPLVAPPTRHRMESPRSTAFTVFKGASESFYAALSAEDQRRFRRYDDPKTMVHDLETHCKGMKEHRKLLASCQAVDKFSKSLSPFFDIINIFVSTKPEFAGIAWGAIRLVFVLSSNFVSFFEKLADMLDRILARLPNYAEHLERLRRRASFQDRSRIFEALSYVYSDIIQFCQSACKIFMTKKGDTRHTFNVVRDLFWTPFDARFSSMLERLRDHQELFDIELRIENQKAIEKSMDAIYDEIVRIKEQIVDYGTSRDIARQEQEALRIRIREIKQWIASPDYMSELENARRNRFPNTCHWVTEHEVYSSWKDKSTFQVTSTGSIHNLGVPFSERILIFQAKPGFGKTTLSAYLIEDLKSSRSANNVTFFHFDSRTLDKKSQSDALRAMTVQMVHHHQKDRDIIDTASLLMDISGSGHPRASDDEVLEIFSLLLSRLPGIILVLDAVDECHEITPFLRTIHDVSQPSSCKVLLLSRPNIALPSAYGHNSHRLDPDLWSNLSDIQVYTRSEVDDLLETVKISGNLTAHEIAHTIADRSRSMFLFAKLMLEYLRSPALTPTDRLNEIQNLSFVEGLESIYERVTNMLAKRFLKEKDVVSRIFRFLTIAIRPLRINEIRTMLAIRHGHPTAESDCIEDLSDTVVRMCGALVEVNDGVVRFVHSSVKDFLVSHLELQKQNYFYVDVAKSHLKASTDCLSYLVYDMPAKPLSGNLEEPADAASLQGELPLLPYASICWAEHLAKGLGGWGDGSILGLLKCSAELAPHFAAFLHGKARISAWIEASWTFNAPPSLESLIASVAKLESQMDAAEDNHQTSFFWICKKLRHFADDLANLESEWAQLLQRRPNEIWGPSVSAYNRSEFWVNTEDTIVSNLLPKDEDNRGKPVFNASKLSADGAKVGILGVFETGTGTNAQFKGMTSNQTDPSENFLRWSAQYQVRTVEADSLSLADLTIAIPPIDLQYIERQLLEGNTQKLKTFRFPIAFSDDLKQVVILRALIRLQGDLDSDSPSKMSLYTSQEIDLCPSYMPRLDRPYEEEPYPSWYRIWSSSDEKYLAVTKRRGKPEVVRDTPWGLWSVTIWKEASRGEKPLYQPFQEIYVNNTNLLKDGYLSFHPKLPLLVVSGDIETLVWSFESGGTPRKRTIYHYPLDNYTFSPDGSFLYSSHKDRIVTIDLRPFIEDENHYLSYSLSPRIDSSLELSGNGFMDISLSNISALHLFAPLAQSRPPALQDTNIIAVRRFNGDLEMSAIRKYDQVGEVVRRSLKRGLAQTETLAYLPQSSNDAKVTLLDPFADDDYVRMVTTHNARESYTYGDPRNWQSPKIIKREKSSITETSVSPLTQADGRQFKKLKRSAFGVDWSSNPSASVATEDEADEDVEITSSLSSNDFDVCR